MSVLVVVRDEDEASVLTRWGCRFASAHGDSLTLFVALKGDERQGPYEVGDRAAKSIDPCTALISVLQDTLSEPPRERLASEAGAEPGETRQPEVTIRYGVFYSSACGRFKRGQSMRG